jgi:hypothetical protein
VNLIPSPYTDTDARWRTTSLSSTRRKSHSKSSQTVRLNLLLFEHSPRLEASSLAMVNPMRAAIVKVILGRRCHRSLLSK